MTVKELKECLNRCLDNATVIISTDDGIIPAQQACSIGIGELRIECWEPEEESFEEDDGYREWRENQLWEETN